MEKAVHNVDGLTKGGPYSHVVEAGGFVFVSGISVMIRQVWNLKRLSLLDRVPSVVDSELITAARDRASAVLDELKRRK